MKQDTQNGIKLVNARYRLNASVCNNNHRWNEDKCRCECKELIDKEIRDKGFIWNPSNCECECDKSCDIGELIDYKNCNWRKSIIDKLVDEYSENIYENETLDIIPLNATPLNINKKYLILARYILYYLLYF